MQGFHDSPFILFSFAGRFRQRVSQALLKLLSSARGGDSEGVSNGRSTPPLANRMEYPLGSEDDLLLLEEQVANDPELRSMLVSDLKCFSPLKC